MSVLWFKSGKTMKYSLSPRAQAIFHCISLLSSQYGYNTLSFPTIRAKELKFRENVYPPPCVPCNASHVTCHVSCVTCHILHFTCILLNIFFGQNYEASKWRVCYQRVLPRLVKLDLVYPKLIKILWSTFSNYLIFDGSTFFSFFDFI